MKKTILLVGFILLNITAYAQVGIGTTTPDASSALDISSTDSGLLVPRMTFVQRNLITTPAEGLLIYQTDATIGFWFYKGGTWTTLGTSGEFQSVAGVVQNTTATATDDFAFGSTSLDDIAGLTDDAKISFDKNKSAFRAGTAQGTQWNDANRGTYSTAFGVNATASGQSSTAFGEGSIASGAASTAFGVNTQSTATRTTSFGVATQASGQSATAFGETTTASGAAATAFGTNTTASGLRAVAFGSGTTASGAVATTFGENTTAVGTSATAFGSNTTANTFWATAFGNSTTASGGAATSFGTSTTASGESATAFGINNTAPSYGETTLGVFADNYTATSNNTYNATDRLFSIGNGTAVGTRSNALTILKNGNIGLGSNNTTPSATLDIKGTFQLEDGNQAANKVLTSDANGNATWQTPAAGGDTDWTVIGTNQYSAVTGNVGIGTVIPAEKLSIEAGNISIRSGNALYGALKLGSDNPTYYDQWAGLESYNTGGSDQSDLRFYTSYGSRGERMRISRLGNIGIGTTAPAEKLHIRGVNPRLQVLQTTTVGGGTYTEWMDGDSLVRGIIGADGVGLSGTPDQFTMGTWTNHPIDFRTNATNRMFISNTGNVGIGTTTPDPSSVLDITSTSSGILIPRMTAAQKTAIATPATGLMIYQTDATDGFWYYNGATWVNISTSSAGEFQSISGVVQNTTDTTTDDFVFGSTQLDDDTAISTDDYRMFYDKSKGAFRAGHANGNQWDDINRGTRSFASGFNNTASGSNSTAMGLGATASGNESIAMGSYTTASGNRSIAMGYLTIAPSYGETTIGILNDDSYTPNSAMDISPNDRLFSIGNGNIEDDGTLLTSNALTVLKNGNIGISTTTPDATLDLVGTLQYTDGNQVAGKVLTSDANGNATWQHVNDNYWVITGNNMAASVTGNVGVGTSAPESKLDIANSVRSGTHAINQSLYVTGNSSSGTLGTSAGNIEFRHSNGTQGIGFGYNSIYATGTNANQDLNILSKGTGNITLQAFGYSTGNVGIGTATPTQAKLQVSGSVANNLAYGYLNSAGNTGTTSGATSLSIYASNRIAAEEFNAFSDARIKNIEGISNATTDLETLNNIKITNYTLKDSIAKGNISYKKVIAQQVKQVYPQAVTNNLSRYIPNIYQLAEINNGEIYLSTNLQKGDKVKLIFSKSEELVEVKKVLGNRFEVLGKNKLPNGKVFVYGKQVNDFHTVDYEAISMLNVSATQELLKRITELETEKALLNTTVKNNLSEISELKEMQTKTSSRLQAIEQLLQTETAAKQQTNQ